MIRSYFRLRYRARQLRAQGSRVKVYGWLLVIDGGRPTHELSFRRLRAHRAAKQRLHGRWAKADSETFLFHQRPS